MKAFVVISSTVLVLFINSLALANPPQAVTTPEAAKRKALLDDLWKLNESRFNQAKETIVHISRRYELPQLAYLKTEEGKALATEKIKALWVQTLGQSLTTAELEYLKTLISSGFFEKYTQVQYKVYDTNLLVPLLSEPPKPAVKPTQPGQAPARPVAPTQPSQPASPKK